MPNEHEKQQQAFDLAPTDETTDSCAKDAPITELTETETKEFVEYLTAIPGFPSYRSVLTFGRTFLRRVCEGDALRARWLVEKACLLRKFNGWAELEDMYNARFKPAGARLEFEKLQRPPVTCSKCYDSGIVADGRPERCDCDQAQGVSAAYLAVAQQSYDVSKQPRPRRPGGDSTVTKLQRLGCGKVSPRRAR